MRAEKVIQALSKIKSDQIWTPHDAVIDEAEETPHEGVIKETPREGVAPHEIDMEETLHEAVTKETPHETVMEETLKPLESSTEGCGQGGDGQLLWLQKEKLRRSAEARESNLREAEMGKCGVLTHTYHSTLPHHLMLAHSMGAPSVKHISLPLLGQYSAKVFTSECLSCLSEICPDLSTSLYKDTPHGYHHRTPVKDWKQAQVIGNKLLHETKFILISRNISQWKAPSSLHTDHTQSHDSHMMSRVMFSPLDSKNLSRSSHVPLQSIARVKDVFISRHPFIFLKVDHGKVR